MIHRLKSGTKLARVAMRTAVVGIRTEYELRRYLEIIGGIFVQSGPFEGLAYLETSHGSVWAAKVLGTYEKELHGVLGALQLASYKRIIDIGCAEGYYLAGLAYMARKQGVNLEVDGYDLNTKAVDAANWLCQINDLSARAHCRRYDLESAADDCTLFIVDIEGDEHDLLSALIVSRLSSCSFIVEVHEPQGSSERLDDLVEAFGESHRVFVVNRTDRSLKDFPEAACLPVSSAKKLCLMDERRERGNAWIIAAPRA